jgi:pyruvate formate lyase activating enzyme
LDELSLKFDYLQGILIFDIKHNSLEDGPGIRSVVFFKGCPLDCIWCQNPESKKISAELWWEKDKCIDCGDCIVACPAGAIAKNNPFYIDRSICTLCFDCVEVCPSNALRRIGIEMSIEEIVSKVLRYKPFFDQSGGGVTLSGGEPTLPTEFTSKLLKRFKEEGIHTLIETAGLFDYNKFESMILPYLDMIFFDIKFIDTYDHNRYCDVNNELILNNFTKLYKRSQVENFKIVPRNPLIPEITDKDENIRQLMEFYKKHNVNHAILLPNNPAWIQKLEKTGQEETFAPYDPIRKFYDTEKENELKSTFLENGIDISFG